MRIYKLTDEQRETLNKVPLDGTGDPIGKQAAGMSIFLIQHDDGYIVWDGYARDPDAASHKLNTLEEKGRSLARPGTLRAFTWITDDGVVPNFIYVI